MESEMLLLNPGPVQVSEEVRAALSKPMISHRTAVFEELFAQVQTDLEYVYTHSRADNEPADWSGETVLFNATATLGMESAIDHLTDADSEVLALINGNFGRRFADMAHRRANVEEYEIPWGESFDMDAVAERIQSGGFDVVTAVHTETSTGLRNPIGEIGAAIQETDAMFVVDGVSSIGGERFHPTEWGVDVSVVDAQKAPAAAPGISAMFLSDRALGALPEDGRSYYGDLPRHLKKLETHQTPFTSAVPLFQGLATSLEEIRRRGVDTWLTRHERYARAWRRVARALDLELFASPAGASDYSNTVTAIELPPAIRGNAEQFFEELLDRNVAVGGGHKHLGGEIFRLTSMGYLEPADLEYGLESICGAFESVGIEVDTDVARDALLTELESAEKSR